MRLTKIVFLFSLLLLAASLFAAEPARFHVESIEVAGGGARVQSIVVAQSLLREGQTYSEGELADAISRIRRLPFVRAVSFSLAKGSERGLYRLVIAVDPMMSLFFDGQASSYTSDNQVPRTVNFGLLTVGGRIPVGSSGMARASVTVADDFEHVFGGEGPSVQPTFALGYSLYRIGSRAVFADVTLAGRRGTNNSFFDDRLRAGNETSANVIVGVPIHGSQSIRAEWNSYRSPYTFETPSGDRRATSRLNSLQLFWLRDTTDDPVYPLHGSLLKAGALGSRGHSAGFGFGPDGAEVRQQRYDSYGAEAAASRYWNLGNERALSLHGSYYNIRTEFEASLFQSYSRSEQLTVGAGFTKRLSGAATDAWLNIRVDGTRNDWSSDHDRLNARIELAHRSKWGIARLGVEYSGQRN
jgi:outer membrane protein assembly factor BamA